MLHSDAVQVNRDRVFFEHLIHDAAIYPPGSAPMDLAVRHHLRYGQSPSGFICGPFLAPFSKLSQLRAYLSEDDELDLAIIGTTIEELQCALDVCNEDTRLRLSHFEIPLPLESVAPFLERLSNEIDLNAQKVFVEVPLNENLQRGLDVISSSGFCAKFRTGGLTKEAFPSEDQLADAIYGAIERNVYFKLTAGLHKALRNSEPTTGFEHHGFLNVIVALSTLLSGGDDARASEILAERDGVQLLKMLSHVDVSLARRVRSIFAGYGSCSIDEPYQELLSLGLLVESESRVD